MSWGFETDIDFQAKLDWAEGFVRTEVQPLDHVLEHGFDMADPLRQALIPPLQQRVRSEGLWACHLGPELGGPGYGQLKLALLNEVLGRSPWAPIVFGCHAPDSGNAEILAHYGTDELKKRYLQPLLANDVVSAFSMTEPRGGSDPTQFTCAAVLDGDEWVINGEKWFTSHARFADFLILLAVTDPDAEPHKRMSMFVVPAQTPGVNIVRNVGMAGFHESEGTHAYIRYEDARIRADHILGGRGDGFVVAQTRLGGGRIHHAMRTVGLVRYAFEMLCERALSRFTDGSQLSRKQAVEHMIADSWVQIEQFRLLVLQTAWKIDKYNDYRKVRGDISAVKAAMPAVLHDVAARALQIHGSLGASEEMPFGQMIMNSFQMGLVDGATEVHKSTLARQVLRQFEGTDDLFPTQHLPRLEEAARSKYAHVLAANENRDAVAVEV
ncbi:acyl-CoA dehydrogenase family protein [Mycolicibacterium porcinum]|uniref:Acyl-CoA dehydrogenase family protein n=1 Tax=Mycolicibacterium porcinum TaxID=39693 RepID=A0AAW5SVR2_9MYCO|nr:acyl-CoA dehydrogenase family protein [Mycolicibacterium porcinum]MCV7386472.1 acyl-CoA dehydrogenase family protein [Mycolicibacterium porcinum]ORB39034.1 acyl-CoA dehydrogenase [Mycolicibacterium porcinum]CDO30858.1 acyl-CoA dehydrogenase domain-containing protein [Mycolicibacterium vulneris]